MHAIEVKMHTIKVKTHMIEVNPHTIEVIFRNCTYSFVYILTCIMYVSYVL